MKTNIKIGQIARYMDDCHCRYGVVSMYNQTVFVRRNNNMYFERTEVFLASTRSLNRNPPVVSVKEAMLYIAWLASNGGPGNAYYPNKIGDPLVRRISNGFIENT